MLDLGCGAGGMSRWLIEQGAQKVLGMDVSERMLELVRAKSQSRYFNFRNLRSIWWSVP